MQIRRLQAAVILGLFFLGGCATFGASKDDSVIDSHMLDLDRDGVNECIEVWDESGEGKETLIVVRQRRSKKVSDFTVAGRFTGIEFFDLDWDGRKQIAVYYKDEKKNENLVIYEYKNSRFSKIFYGQSTCRIEADFSAMIARVKIARPARGQRDCFPLSRNEWETWVWTGEEFVRER
ncbi:hypothetical protein ACFLZ3_05235 [Candidatus Omnitrophota bacterium]